MGGFDDVIGLCNVFVASISIFFELYNQTTGRLLFFSHVLWNYC